MGLKSFKLISSVKSAVVTVLLLLIVPAALCNQTCDLFKVLKLLSINLPQYFSLALVIMKSHAATIIVPPQTPTFNVIFSAPF